jgi:hypothetical protein
VASSALAARAFTLRNAQAAAERAPVRRARTAPVSFILDSQVPMKPPIEKLAGQDLVKEWQAELSALHSMDQSNPTWEWKPVQRRLERLHVLAQELRKKKAEERAKWQP